METDRPRDPEISVEVLINCRVNPSEDADKIMVAIRNIFPDAELEVKEGEVSGRTGSVRTFSEKLMRQRIRNAAKAHLRKRTSRSGDIVFYLNKQVAFVGAVNFVDKDVILGGIEVTFRTDDPEGLIESLTI